MKNTILDIFAENLDAATFTTKGDITKINFEHNEYVFDVNIEESTGLMLDFEAYNSLDEDKGLILNTGDDNEFEDEVFEILESNRLSHNDWNNTGMQT
tara:strand:+ start:438 stop:731 length:294 start_codon:yes stop_codon:yes gene_type:complete